MSSQDDYATAQGRQTDVGKSGLPARLPSPSQESGCSAQYLTKVSIRVTLLHGLHLSCRDSLDARFNRFYTRQFGLLEKGLLGSKWNLSETRVLYELVQRSRADASDIAVDLQPELGYLNRLMRGLALR